MLEIGFPKFGRLLYQNCLAIKDHINFWRRCRGSNPGHPRDRFMWGGIPTPHEPCSYYYSPYHHVKDCPTAGQFSNYSYEHMNTQFSRPRNEPY
jgi:hypothetical protein